MTDVTRLLQDALAAAAGRNRPVAPLSFTVDFGAEGPGEPVAAARIERSTKTLVFVTGEARLADGRLAATASGVYRAL